jgi:hypothetical protein
LEESVQDMQQEVDVVEVWLWEEPSEGEQLLMVVALYKMEVVPLEMALL